MPTKTTVKTTKIFNLLIFIFQSQWLMGFEKSRHQKARLMKKAEHFILIDGQLYLFSKNENHKKVVPFENQDLMLQEAMGLHMGTHIDQNKMDSYEISCTMQFLDQLLGLSWQVYNLLAVLTLER